MMRYEIGDSEKRTVNSATTINSRVLRGRKGGELFQKRLLCAQATARSVISLTWTLAILLVEISRILDNS